MILGYIVFAILVIVGWGGLCHFFFGDWLEREIIVRRECRKLDAELLTLTREVRR